MRSGGVEDRLNGVLAAKRKQRYYLLGMIAVLVISVGLSTSFGSIAVAMDDVWKVLLFKTTGIKCGEWPISRERIVWMIRMPRILFAVVVGGGLAVVGAALQAVVRNPMADPYILGMSAGASTGAAFVILVNGMIGADRWSISLAAFIGALSASVLVLLFSRAAGRMTPRRLILSGVAVSYLFSAMTSFLAYLAPDDQLREVTYWLLGSVAPGKWENLLLPAVVVSLGGTYLYVQARRLNAISMGEETAASLGVNGSRLRRRVFVVTCLMTGMLVAVSGAIGFVGLMVPHMVRLVCGNEHRRLLPLCMVGGAVFLVWADVVARSALAPRELPIGIVTALCGAPFFIGLLHRSGRGH